MVLGAIGLVPITQQAWHFLLILRQLILYSIAFKNKNILVCYSIFNEWNSARQRNAKKKSA